MKMYDSSNALQKCMKIAMLPEHKTHVAPNSMKQLSHFYVKAQLRPWTVDILDVMVKLKSCSLVNNRI